ncbi:hypothetical protein [Gracilibacillus salinarum]|uniref:Uncharacterized protein n=1 Tax=Gracilibacillus salinarum TaxID=2932255 RepID=A0ABY4GR11_9BACI|nr:hypothetical protein [Gracilibacillus salinarum]UOQ86583.1 hypothetical protein MUN87_06765 [Gracilibacillus salinarum]
MKITLETFRFALLLVLFGTVLSFISYMLLYPMIGENAERYYSWVATIGSFVLLLFLYQKKVGLRVILRNLYFGFPSV